MLKANNLNFQIRKMGLTSSSLLAFSSGLMLGASSIYYLLKFYQHPNDQVWKPGTEERFEYEDPHDEYRLVMAIRNDLKMQKGKVAAQCGHAAVAAYAKSARSSPKLLKNWLKYGGTKIAVRIDSEEELLELDRRSKEIGVLSSIIRDAGQTQVAPGSRTVIAIGPAPKTRLDQITGHLKLY